MQSANAKRAKEGLVMTDDERRKLVSTEQSLAGDPEPKMPSAISGLETFSLSGNSSAADEDETEKTYDADSFFNLPDDKDENDK